jgi:two-component system, chemotaxis family, chemotaxis protein CheY
MAYHILVVDDDPAHRELMRAISESAGYRVTEAENGKLALELSQQDPPDLVLLDLIMPEQDGIETLRKLKKVTPNLNIIVVSGFAKKGHSFLNSASLLGADKTLLKPFEPKLLLAAMEELLGKIGDVSPGP